MFFSNFFNSIKSRLGIKSIIISILLICAISLILSAFFVTRQKKLLMNELHKRALSLSNTLVFNSQFPFIARDGEQLLKLLEGVKQEDDIVDAFFTTKGTFGGISTINFHSDTSMVGQKIHIPLDFDFDATLRGDWFSSGDGNKIRIVSPVLGLPAEDSVSDEFLFPSPELEGRRDILYGRPFFPCFTADSKEITFSMHRGFGWLDIWKYNIETRSYSKFLESAANGWWSHDGRYFVFNKVNEETVDCDTSILDTKTGEVRVIQKNSKYPQPHFSFDDKYILSTVENENNANRIVRIPFEGGTPEQITFHDVRHYWPESSPDGKWILYFDELSNSMYVYNTEKEESSRVFPDFDVYHGAGTFSPDGKKSVIYNFRNIIVVRANFSLPISRM